MSMSLADLDAHVQRAQEQQRANMLQEASTYCTAYGYKTDTTEYSRCVQTEVNQARERADRRAEEIRLERLRAERNAQAFQDTCHDGDKDCNPCTRSDAH
mgnify:CR=1 FL=1